MEVLIEKWIIFCSTYVDMLLCLAVKYATSGWILEVLVYKSNFPTNLNQPHNIIANRMLTWHYKRDYRSWKEGLYGDNTYSIMHMISIQLL